MLLLSLALLLPGAPPPAGSAVTAPAGASLRTVAESCAAQSRTPTTVTTPTAGTKLDRTLSATYWDAVAESARVAGGRVEVRPGGREVVVTPGEPGPSSVAGAFRTSVVGVACRRDFAGGEPVTEVALALHWEARIPVVRVDAAPTVSRVADDRGPRATPAGGRSRVAARDAEQLTTLRLAGVPRAATRLTLLEGEFAVTAAPSYVTVNVPAFGVPVVRGGVTVAVSAPARVGSRVEVVLTLAAPSPGVAFESFEAGLKLSRTTLELVAPTGERFTPVNFDDEESAGAARVTYRFAGSLPVGPGWAAVVVTPAPLEEYRVPFTLRDVPLP